MLENVLGFCFVLLLTLAGCAVAIAPAVGLSFYLAPSPSIRRKNMAVTVVAALLGGIAAASAFDPIPRTPPVQAYLIVGAWAGGVAGAVFATFLRFVSNPRAYRLQFGLRSLLIVLTLLCAAIALVHFVWSLDW